jgi:hypothetical protein
LLNPMYAQWAHAMAPWVLPLAAVAVLLTPTGLALMVWSSRRRFYRRNFAGVEEFPSYGHVVGNRLIEGLVERSGSLLLMFGLIAGFAAGYGLYLQGY